MIVSRMDDGLGDQMFQYAIASVLVKNNNASVLLDLSFFDQKEKRLGHIPRNFELTVFNNFYNRASKTNLLFFKQLSIFNKVKRKLSLNYPKIYNEPSFDFQTGAMIIKLPVYLKGYFQSCKYFIGHEDFIRQIFSFPIAKLDSINKELLFTIKSFNTIAIHI